MSKRYSGKSFKDNSAMKKPKLTFKEKKKLKEEKKRKDEKTFKGSWFWVIGLCGITRTILELKEIKQNLSEYERRKVAPTLENHTGSW